MKLFSQMGYGSRAIKLLQEYYSGKMIDLGEKSVEEPIQDITGVPDEDLNILSERIGKLNICLEILTTGLHVTCIQIYSQLCLIIAVPRKNLPPLLLKLTERSPEVLHYIGVSYGVTLPLLKFWKRAGYLPVYMRYTNYLNYLQHFCAVL